MPSLQVNVGPGDDRKERGIRSPVVIASPLDIRDGEDSGDSSPTTSEYVSLSEDESADEWSSDDSKAGDKTEEQLKEERHARELERQRVLEAAGLIVKPTTDAPPLARVRSVRRRRAPPPPSSSRVHPPPAVPEEEDDQPPPVPPKSPTSGSFTLDDAYDRYERYQHDPGLGKRDSRLSTNSMDVPPSPTAPSLSLSWTPSRGPDAPPESRYGALFALFGRSKTPGAEEHQQKTRPVISAPILSPTATGPSRESSPAFGSVRDFPKCCRHSCTTLSYLFTLP